MEETPDPGGGLAGAGRAFEEDFVSDGAIDERELVAGKSRKGHFMWCSTSAPGQAKAGTQ